MKQFCAAYCSETIKKLFLNTHDYHIFKELTNYLSYFDVHYSADYFATKLPANVRSVFLSLKNYITRGKPAFLPIEIEKQFADIFCNITTQPNQPYNFSTTYKSQIKENFRKNIIAALHIIDPRIENKHQFKEMPQTWENIPGGFEIDFRYSILPHFIGAYAMQMFDYQRNFASIAVTDSETSEKPVDFSLELPYHQENKKGIIVEIDGKVHYKVTQRKIDVQRNDAATNAGWKSTIHIDTNDFDEISKHIKPLKEFTNCEFMNRTADNFKNPLYNNENGMDALQFALTPVAIARIQYILLDAVLKGMLDYNAEKWSIAIVERDIPAAYPAIENFMQLLKAITPLHTNKYKAPEIEVDVYNTNEFLFAKLNTQYFNSIRPVEGVRKNKPYDLLIDVSVLMRSNVHLPIENNAKQTITIRSALSIKPEKKIPLIPEGRFLPLTGKTGKPVKKQIDAVNYLLQNIFKKNNLYTSQDGLLNQLLQNQNTLATMPYGSGKTFMLMVAAVLRHKKTLFIVPNNLLKQEFYEFFSALNIGYAKSLHPESDLKAAKIIIATPNDLRNIRIDKILLAVKSYIGAVYIDEVQTLSEWNCNFLPEMSRIYQQIRLFTNIEQINIAACTALHSYEIVEDILSELNITPQNIFRIHQANSGLSKIIVKQFFSNEIKKYKSFSEAETLSNTVKFDEAFKIISEIKAQKKRALILASDRNISNKARTGIADKVEAWLSEGQTVLSVSNLKNITDFRCFKNSLKPILTATPALLNGAYFKPPSKIAWFDMPLSVNELLRINRMNRSKEPVDTVILLNNRKFTVENQKKNDSKTTNKVHTIGTYHSLQQLKNKLPGRSKEDGLVADVFKNITAAPQKKAIVLEKLVLKEFGMQVVLDSYPEIYPYELVLYSVDTEFARIEYPEGIARTNEEAANIRFSAQIIEFIKSYIRQQTNSQSTVFEELFTEERAVVKPGITHILNTTNQNQATEVVLPFDNNTIWKISQELCNVSPDFTEEAIAACYTTGVSYSVFREKLNNIQNIDNKTNIDKYLSRVEQLFAQIRNENETRILIHRLSECGIIESYSVENEKQQFVLSVKNLPRRDLIANLSRNISKNLSPNKIFEYINSIEKEKGATMAQKIVHTLIRFIYTEVIETQLSAVYANHKLLSKGGQAEYDVTKNIEQFEKYWFYARYANTVISPNIATSTNNLTKTNFNTVVEFISHAGYKRDNWKHLKASCRHLLKSNPNDYALKLLWVFTSILLNYKNTNTVASAIDTSIECFQNMKQTEKLTANQFVKNFNLFFEKIYEQAAMLRKFVEPLAVAKLHNYWLLKFTAKFLEGYGNES